ncbi:hypothetical protein O181_018074 [Austropuccinia psidii MF-1]|uniref:Chromo domain-containing protein n=1 Tax=Austropuccinia psidii MF-1 TaxID=1389203 RepID=A0A9Q3GTE6_9BASI|nr:hypothetical protein [Austropuccinia psidii MF-1]
MSRIGYWVERAYIHVYKRGLASRRLDQLASYPGNFDTLQEIMDITLEVDTRYHERQKEKGSHHEKNPPVTGSNPSRPPKDSSSKRPHHKKNKKGKQFQDSRDEPHSALLTKDNKLIGSEKNSFISKAFALKYSLTISELPEKIPFVILDSNESPSLFITHYTKWVVDLPSFLRLEWEFFIVDSPKGEDLILGYDFLYHSTLIIDWKNRLITYDSSHKDSSGIKFSSSNSLATAVNSVALVGELKTPLLLSLVHIPSIMPSQSLLKSREEVFKEIKDFGEPVAISSLNFFHEDMDLSPLSFHASLEEQWDEEEEPEEIEAVLKVVPPAYSQYLDVFSKVKAEKLPLHHACDHHFELEGLLPPVGVIYYLSNQESETLWAYISENVEKGFIRPISSSAGEPVLFLKKKDGCLCLCVGYRKLNAITRKNRYPVPPMNQLLTVFNGPTIFSKIDLCGEYNLLRIKEGDAHLTAFRTKYGSYEYLVMPFGCTKAPASFQNLRNDIFSDFLDIFVLVYLEDILGFFSSEEEHVKHVASVLQILRDNKLFAKASKCVLHASSVEYLGYVFSSDGLKMDSSKLQQILNWPQPKNIKALQPFLGFANFYRRFIKNYSKKITVLTSLLKKDSPFIFKEEARSQFQILKEAFTTAPILSHFNLSLQTIVETATSDYGLGAVLSQVNDLGKQPIAFDSCKLLPAELNYEIHDKELLGIAGLSSTEELFFFLFPITLGVLTDHSSLQYFMSSIVLTRCQAHWAEFLSEFHFTITYHPGRLATLPDSLSHRDNMYPGRGWTPSARILRIFINYHQDDWHTWLPLAIFAYNNEENSSTKKSPFFTIYGRNPIFDTIHVSQDSPAGKVATKLQSVQQVVKEELESEIRRFKKYADRNRSIPPDFQPGDKKIGSYAYHLKLPQQWKSVHPVFHVSLLEPFKQSSIPNSHHLPPPPALVEEQEEWEVAHVFDSKLKRGKLWYIVAWKGFSEDPERTTWEPTYNLSNLPELVKDFHSLYPDKPGQNTSRV